MKKFFAAFALLAVLALPMSASAQGFYVAPKFLMTIQDTGTVSKTGLSDVKDYSQFTLGGALAAGFDFYPAFAIPVRAELELAMRGDSKTAWDGWGTSTKALWNNTTMFLNFFVDWHNDSAFTPYIGAGVGMAFRYAGYDVSQMAGLSAVTMKSSKDDYSTSFAWNLGAGVAYEITENIAIDLGYRFVSFSEHSTSWNGYKLGVNPYNHEIMLGVRFTF